ncbi:chromosome segregation ATPase [Paenibacillus xylanexedens]|uniref:chromosome segregation ATPase n=1 Tax=Paenibacillus xylanexedens TaxID=528191 RepID=UPI0011A1269E|nr:chromosome segregation ATPase [Paenibacillus xylanexedens]
MPSISKIRFAHVVYEGGNKRYNDETFIFDGHNGAVVLENGGGKTVFIQTAIQAVLPHADLAGRKAKETYSLEQGPAHVAIEWILTEKPRRRYALTSVSLYQTSTGIDSYRYVYEYGENDRHSLSELPFTHVVADRTRVADKGEIQDYYSEMAQRYPLQAQTFSKLKTYKAYLEEHFQIISGEWEAIVKINSSEGGIEAFFDECKTTSQLFDRLLIPEVERSIEEFEPDSFVRIFEEQREGFETYKKLKEQIAENNAILTRLNGYVDLFQRLDQQQNKYNESRRKAKAYWMLSTEQQQELIEEQQQLLLREQELKDALHTWARKNDALNFAVNKQQLDVWDTKLHDIREERDEAAARKQQAEQQYFSLQYAEVRENSQVMRAKLKGLATQLGTLEASDNEKQLEQDWHRNGAMLKHVYELEFQQRNRIYEGQQSQLHDMSNVVGSLRQKANEVREEGVEQGNLLAAQEAEQRLKLEQLTQIAREILSNPQLEKVEQQVPIWIQEEQDHERKRISIIQEVKQLEEDRKQLEQRRKDGGKELSSREQLLIRIEEQEAQLEKTYEEVKAALSGIGKDWVQSQSIYEKQTSIKNRLDDAILRLKQDKEKQLLMERISWRYIDDHGEQEPFFADPVIYRLANQWQAQFTLLKLGTQYVQEIQSEVPVNLADGDHLWAVTLVTTAHEKEALIRKISGMKGEHSYPIRVWSTQEALERIRGDVQEENTHSEDHLEWIVPAHWMSNEQPASFATWKSLLLEEANEAQQKREHIEAEIMKWEYARSKLVHFLEHYPLQLQQELEQQRLREQGAITKLSRELDRTEYDLEVNRETQDTRKKTMEHLSASILRLGQLLQAARRYEIIAGEVTRLEQEMEKARASQTWLQVKQKRLEGEWQLAEKDREKVKASLQETANGIQLLQQQEVYQEIKSYTAEVTTETLSTLREIRKTIHLKRQQISVDRTMLEAQIHEYEVRVQEYENHMTLLKKEHTDINEDMIVPIHPEEKKSVLWQDKVTADERLQRLNGEFKQVEQTYTREEGALEHMRRQYEERFGTAQPEVFHEALSTVRERLTLEKNQLAEQEKKLADQIVLITKQLGEVELVMSLWNRHMMLHALEDVGLQPSDVSIEERSQFTYQRRTYADGCVQEMISNYRDVQVEQDKVKKGRQSLTDFVRIKVKDIKLQQTTLQGIESKETYNEVVEFQQVMNQRIQMAIHIWEQTLQTHDQDLQQFIHHIHTHVKLIVQELREIPKKTRVRTADGWKDIFSFSIPVWDVQDGKERIRQHIDWIVQQLERLSRQDSHSGNTQGNNEIRRNLEKWLDTRQLLQVVLSGDVMKVNCRKVGNDQVLSKAAYSWEQSNRWSGGEKWSKNMTLFLGLLNYVAEKKQHLRSQIKRHRTVILDNPFGKASSDHVLHPVFFVAEQLGFQIIALTAHVEGKFLQDYFPVVYSCRLRSSTNGTRQIIETSQRISPAYFQDYEPEVLERLGGNLN